MPQLSLGGLSQENFLDILLDLNPRQLLTAIPELHVTSRVGSFSTCCYRCGVSPTVKKVVIMYGNQEIPGLAYTCESPRCLKGSEDYAINEAKPLLRIFCTDAEGGA